METEISVFYGMIEDLVQRMDGCFSDLPAKALDWTPDPAINSLSVLVVHTAAALGYWVGEIIGGKPAGRDRSSEFMVRELSKAELHRVLYAALETARKVLEDLSLDRLGEMVYSPIHNDDFSVAFALAHALEHTALHLGHMEVVRELWEQVDLEAGTEGP